MKNTKLVLIVSMMLAVWLSVPLTVQSASKSAPNHFLPQDPPAIAAIKTADGYLLVWNRPDIHFTVLIKGKDIKPLNDSEHPMFQVDGMLLQIQLADVGEFAADAKEKKLDDTAILAAHRDWESKFAEEQLGGKLKVESSSTKLSSGAEALLWQYDMPEALKAEAKKQVYLTLVGGEHVIVLNSAVTAKVSEEQARKLLQDTVATLKTSPDPIDVKKLAISIRDGVAP
jgi:hypothetical protein